MEKIRQRDGVAKPHHSPRVSSFCKQVKRLIKNNDIRHASREWHMLLYAVTHLHAACIKKDEDAADDVVYHMRPIYEQAKLGVSYQRFIDELSRRNIIGTKIYLI
jgi:hypothetical protein